MGMFLVSGFFMTVMGVFLWVCDSYLQFVVLSSVFSSLVVGLVLYRGYDYPVGFEPKISAGERPQTYALDRAATGTGKG
jgi:hypothetical protein